MNGRSYVCQYCGKGFVLNRSHGSYRPKYCSGFCYSNARFGEVIADELPQVRNPQCLEAAKLCKAGLSQAEAAKRTGINIHILGDWLHKYGAETIFAGRVCAWCGKPFEGMSHLSVRKYCSNTCRSKMHESEKYLVSGRKKAKADPELRLAALELYWQGIGCADISRHLDIPKGTVYSWIHHFGGLRDRQRTYENMSLWPLSKRLEYALNAEEWAQMLHEATGGGGAKTDMVRLVCGAVNGKGGISQYATIIADKLKIDPCGGEIFALCNKAHTAITTIQWHNGAFRLVRMPKRYGSYIWPLEGLGISVTIGADAFNYLLSYQKQNAQNS